MTQVDAIYQDGMFKPLQDVQLAENQRVRLSFQLLEAVDIESWLAAIQEQQKRIIGERAYFPDSAASIAEDRRR
jgi:predicted DNA-binding antitoxin AbrB/MazE fold protein